MLFETFLPSKVANTLIEGECCCPELGLAKMRGQEWLTFHGCGFLRTGDSSIGCHLPTKTNNNFTLAECD